jgi:hypothetical protein
MSDPTALSHPGDRVGDEADALVLEQRSAR